MRPVERLAVDVLLEQTLAHHQAEILARAPPRRVGGLVNDVAQVVEAAGIGRLAGGQPMLARLPALPGARGEAEDLDLDAAALERARENVGAGRRDRDRTAAHRAGIVEQQRHHRVAEIGVLLALERERVHRVDDDAREPRRIEHAFVEIEFPGAVLLRHQAALQAVGEAGDHALQMRELLVEIAAQAIEFFRLAQILGRDLLVELADEGMIFRPAIFGARPARPPGLGGRFGIAHIGVIGHLGRWRIERLGGGVLRLVARTLGLFETHALQFVGVGGFALLAGFVLTALLFALVAFLLVFGIGIAVLAHVERIEQIVDRVAKALLVLDQPLEAIEPAAGLVLDQRTPEVDKLLRRRRRRLAGQPLAHHHRDRFLDRRIGAIGDVVEFAAVEFVVEHGGEILRNAGHAARADRLHTRLLDRVEHRARLLAAGNQLAMHRRIVTGELERERIRVSAHDRRFQLVELASGLRQPHLAARDARPLGGVIHLELGLLGERAQAAGHRALERLVRRFLGRDLRFVIRGHALPADLS